MQVHPHKDKVTVLMRRLFGRLRHAAVVFAASLFTVSVPSIAAERSMPIKVGIYENRPMVFLDDDTRPAGLQVDIVSEIAKARKWPIEFVYGTWQDCLARLEDGEIDVLLDIGYSDERAQRFDFTSESLFSTWAQVYVPPGSTLLGIPDLEGKHIAVMRGDVHYAALQRLLRDFGIAVHYVEYDDYKDLMQAVEHKRVDAGLFSRIAGLQLESDYGVRRSSIVLDPIQVRIAFPKGKNGDIRDAIDADLRRMKRDPNSAYSVAMDKWLGNVPLMEWPWWWKWAVLGLAAFALIGVGVNSLLRLEVRRKTSQLTAKNVELEQEIASRARVESLLQAGRERLSTQSRALMTLARSDAIDRGDLDAALRQITTAAAQTLDVDRSSVWIAESDLSAIRCICLFVRSKGEFSKGAELARTDYPIYFRALAENRIIAASDAARDPSTYEFADSYLAPLGITSMLDAPVRTGQRLIGILCNEHTGAAREWNLEEENFAASLADFVALALEAHERQTAEARLRESEERNRLIIEKALDAVIIADNRGTVIGWNAKAEEVFGYARDEAIGQPVISLVVPESIHEIVAQEFLDILRSGRGRTRRDVLAKRKNGEEFYAEFSVSASREGRRFIYTSFVRDITEQKRAQEMKEKLHQIETELELARTIQRSFLPQQFPAFPHRCEFEVYAEMIPAANVGGDFYDFYLLDDERLAFAIGDVSGKGVPGALVMAMTLTILKATAASTPSVSDCVSQVNRLLCKENEAAFFVTLFYGVLHVPTGKITFANAGHPPPFRVSSTRGVKPLDGTGGLILGVFEEAQYSEGEIALKSGESVLLFTDGVTEAMNESNILYTEERLEQTLRGVSGMPATPLVAHVVKDVESFAGDAPRHDDITLLALRYLS
ncbi:MAG: SpoIIE family protein phosphatase [Candidatus Hydrogenedentes bacterium]|nr:SpoIIE family protein phosphatase [Candidatus Hydrogenedentota bacterium]